MSLPVKFDEFEKEFVKTWNEYTSIDRELDQFRGVSFEDRIDEVRDIIKRKQDKFFELVPSLNWAIARKEFAVLACKDFETFVEALKMTGTEVPNESQAQA